MINLNNIVKILDYVIPCIGLITIIAFGLDAKYALIFFWLTVITWPIYMIFSRLVKERRGKMNQLTSYALIIGVIFAGLVAMNAYNSINSSISKETLLFSRTIIACFYLSLYSFLINGLLYLIEKAKKIKPLKPCSI
jgi:uncharacterized membrane protein YcaP (DUF421 family)